ncbi:AraC family transcriptional regulator [Brevibacillus reuszeri]|uniref:AraC family transcriptional regulator n=1 Tax=Brevibacillus reuszeri TaxID=54915 RepID=UPI003D202AF6
MNTIIYELQGTRLLADRGTLSPAALRISYPAIIVPTEAIILRTASAVYQVEKGQFISFRHVEENMSIETAENTEFAPVYVVSYHSYQLTEKTPDSLLYYKREEHLPKQGSVMEFPRPARGLLESLLEQLQQASWVQIAARLNLKLDELLRSIFVSKHYGVSYITQEPSILQALTYINQHFDAAVTRSFMARLTGFNPSYFSSLFRRETGWSFAEYLNRIRIDEAK